MCSSETTEVDNAIDNSGTKEVKDVIKKEYLEQVYKGNWLTNGKKKEAVEIKFSYIDNILSKITLIEDSGVDVKMFKVLQDYSSDMYLKYSTFDIISKEKINISIEVSSGAVLFSNNEKSYIKLVEEFKIP